MSGGLKLVEHVPGTGSTRLSIPGYEFFALLSSYTGLHFLDLDLSIANEAAKIRTQTKLRTPDAIQAASAIAFGASGFIGNDAAFKKVSSLDVLVLKDCIV